MARVFSFSARVRARVFAPCALAFCIGCPGTLEDPARFGATQGVGGSQTGTSGTNGEGFDAAACDDVPKSIFLQSCVNAGCHDARDKVQGLDLESSNVEARLIGIRASEGAGLLIDPASPQASVIYTKMTKSPPFGARMPLSGALDDAHVDCVLDWITQQSAQSPDSGIGSDASREDEHEDAESSDTSAD